MFEVDVKNVTEKKKKKKEKKEQLGFGVQMS